MKKKKRLSGIERRWFVNNVGVIMLLGIVKKNAIMMLDFALEAQRHDPSRTPLDAITEGCHVRFRPIMMTTAAAILGAGAGGGVNRAVAGRIVRTWLWTFPGCGLLGFLLASLFRSSPFCGII